MIAQQDTDEISGRLVENIVYFARALRKAGIRIGTSQVESAVLAVQATGFAKRSDFYHTLRATMINRAEHIEIFHQVFNMFWRDPDYLQHMMHMLSPTLRTEEEPEKKSQAAERRASEALSDIKAPESPPPKSRDDVDVMAEFTWSADEVLRARDFEQMSNAEIADATRAIRALRLPVRAMRTRRHRLSARGHRPDLHATLRNSMRRGGEIGELARQAPRYRAPDLVAFCDISGSMSVYSRMLMHFLHALVTTPDGNWGRINAFTFGTRLTNISRSLHRKDPDEALDAIGREAQDWQGGTRIGPALERFNKDWSRRVLGQGAVVLLITDGLERGDTDLLAREVERLHLSCRQLIWLNPLLRWEGFAPKAAGIRAILPHVDSFHACHNLDSLEDLSRALSEPVQTRRLRSTQTEARTG